MIATVKRCAHCGGLDAPGAGLRIERRGRASLVCGQRRVHVMPMTARIIEALLGQRGAILHRERLWARLYRNRRDGSLNVKSLDVHLHHARTALDAVEAPVEIVTVWGDGWMLVERQPETAPWPA